MIRMGKKKTALLAVLILVIAGAAYWLYDLRMQEEAARTLTLHGNADVREVSLAFRESDRISEVLVSEGDTVKKGDVLARLDAEELKLEIAKIRSDIAAQEAAVDKLHNGERPEIIRQARANYESAQAAADNAELLYQRQKQIYDTVEGVSRQELDNALSDRNAKAGAAEAARQTWEEAQNGAREEDIRAGEAQLQSLKDTLARENYLLTQYELKSPADGVVRSRLLEPGDMAGPSSPVFKISLLDKKWVRVYAAETDLPKLYEGQKAQVYLDGLKETLEGQVGYISGTAEFTPKTVQTEELRTALVYEVRVYVDDRDNRLRLGMPATVRIDL